MLYTEYLTPEERRHAIRIGAAMAMAEAGLTVREFDGIAKSAASKVPVPLPSLSAVGNAAIVAGVPLGLLYYVVSRSINKSDAKTRRMQRELDYYNDVVAEFKNRKNLSESYMEDDEDEDEDGRGSDVLRG